MQTLTERVLELSPPGGLFDSAVVSNLFPDCSVGARKLLVHRAVRAGEVLRLAPGTYLLAFRIGRRAPHPFVVASLLHAPSHISLESALAHHGLIPEAVYQVASVTTGRSRVHHTPVGVFTFRRVPVRMPLAGVEVIKVGGEAWVHMACPMRAVADLVYLDKRVAWTTSGLGFLTDSLRIEEDDLSALVTPRFHEIYGAFADRRVQGYLRGLHGEITHD
jgi:hypothetical protein